MTASTGMKGRGQGAMRIATHTKLQPYMNNSLIMALESPAVITENKENKGKKIKDTHFYFLSIVFLMKNWNVNAIKKKKRNI